MNRNFTVALIFFLIASGVCYGQQRPVISQYMFNGLVLNPAFAGSHHQISATGLYRDQWTNFPGAPSLSTFSVHSGLDNGRVGVGMLAYKDKVGVHNDLGLYGMYSYRIKAPHGVLSMGLQGGFNHRSSDWGMLNQKNPGDPNFKDVAIAFKPNFGTGLYYYTNSFYVGASVPYILNNRIINELGQTISGQERRYYYITAGKLFDLTDKIKFKPSTLLRIHESAPVGIDLNANVIFDDVLSLGGSYRSGDAVTLLFELKVSHNFRFGYAYDMITSTLSQYTSGSHEFMVNYRFNLTGVSNRIPCPSFLN